MRARWWVLFIGLNVVVSVLTTLAVLELKGEAEKVVIVTATPAAGLVSQAPTQAPTPQITGPTPSPTTPADAGYTVQPGDTLGGIALANGVALENLLSANGLTENDVIQPGQTLVIPIGDFVAPTATVTPSPVPATPTPLEPTPFPTETPTPPGPVQVRIQELLAPGELPREGVVLVNRGRTVNLASWTLAAAGGEAEYVFPRLTLTQETPVTVYTIGGEDSPQELHWDHPEALWTESGAIVELRDAEGNLIATFPVP